MSQITMHDVAVMSVQYVQHSFSYYLNSMQTAGLSRVDLWGGSPHYCRLDYPTSLAASRRVAQLRRDIEDHGMQVVIYTPETLGYPFSYSSPEVPVRERTIDFMRSAMEDALAFGTNRVFVNTGCHPRDLDREEGWKRTVESFGILCEQAERLGVQLILEQLQPYESNLVICLEDVKRMLAEVNSPALNCCVDLTAMEVAGECLEDYCLQLGERLQWVHYSDSHHLILGEGTLGREKLEGYIRTLERFDFQNGIDLEINDSIYWEDPHTSVQRSADYLRTFLSEK